VRLRVCSWVPRSADQSADRHQPAEAISKTNPFSSIKYIIVDTKRN